MKALKFPVANDWQGVEEDLNTHGFSYLPLGSFCTELERIMQLRHLLGLRSPVNTLARLINPLAANAGLQSVFHPAYADIHQQADALLGQPHAVVFKGESGEVEIKPHADTQVHRLIAGEYSRVSCKRTISTRVAPVTQPSTAPLLSLWCGDSQDDYGEAATIATAAIGLMTLEPTLDMPQALEHSASLWANRDT